MDSPSAVSGPAPRGSGIARPLARGALLLLLVAFPFVVGLVTTPFRHDATALMVLGVLYVGLGVALHAGFALSWRLGAWAALPYALGVAGLFGLGLRWDAEMLASQASFGGFALGGGAVLFLLSRVAGLAAATRPGSVALCLRGVAALLVTSGGVSLAFHQSDTLRWHLLQHHRLFGHPAYVIFSSPIRAEREALWDSQPRLVEPWERAAEAVVRRPAGGAGTPHIVFVLVDTLRADGMAAWGGEPEVMPFSNQLADRSIVLTDVLANASWTRASVASILTGLLPEEHGAVRYHDRLSEEWHTAPELLKQAGFRTAAFVSNWVQIGIETGFDQGFDHFDELQGDQDRDARAQYMRAEQINDTVFEWLDAQPTDHEDPYFLYVHYLDPHSPYLSGAEPGLEGGPRVQKLGAYRQELRYFDAQLQVLFEGLEERFGDDFALILTSDHGEEFWEHGQWGHGHALYREVVHVPAFVYLPQGEQEGRLDARLELRDLFDLMLALGQPGSLDMRAWADQCSRTTRYASQFLDRIGDFRPDKKRTAMRMVEEESHELIWSGYGPTWELYDLRSDPTELDNVADRSAEDKARMERLMPEAVSFWALPPKVVRSKEAVSFLKALGYAGGADEEEIEGEEADPDK